MAKGPGRRAKAQGLRPAHPPRWEDLLLGWKGRLLAVAFTAMIVVMGFALHGSVIGRLVEGAVFVTSIIVLWLTGTSPEAHPRSSSAAGDRSAGGNVDQ